MGLTYARCINRIAKAIKTYKFLINYEDAAGPIEETEAAKMLHLSRDQCATFWELRPLPIERIEEEIKKSIGYKPASETKKSERWKPTDAGKIDDEGIEDAGKIGEDAGKDTGKIGEDAGEIEGEGDGLSRDDAIDHLVGIISRWDGPGIYKRRTGLDPMELPSVKALDLDVPTLAEIWTIHGHWQDEAHYRSALIGTLDRISRRNAEGKIDDDAGKIGDDAGKIDDDAGKIDDDAGKIDDDAGKIDDDAGKIGDDAGEIDETNEGIDEPPLPFDEAKEAFDEAIEEESIDRDIEEKAMSLFLLKEDSIEILAKIIYRYRNPDDLRDHTRIDIYSAPIIKTLDLDYTSILDLWCAHDTRSSWQEIETVIQGYFDRRSEEESVDDAGKKIDDDAGKIGEDTGKKIGKIGDDEKARIDSTESIWRERLYVAWLQIKEASSYPDAIKITRDQAWEGISYEAWEEARKDYPPEPLISDTELFHRFALIVLRNRIEEAEREADRAHYYAQLWEKKLSEEERR